jgi:tRNA(Ile)-lysidine synthase
MPAPKKLQDILVDAKVPRRLRDLVPILEGPSGILWVATHRIAEEAKISDGTGTALELRLEPLTNPARELVRLYT